MSYFERGILYLTALTVFFHALILTTINKSIETIVAFEHTQNQITALLAGVR